MDRYLFRGKREFDGKWVIGNLIKYKPSNEHFIYDGFGEDIFENYINPETIGQCTGLNDKNEKLIFEGDVVNCFGGEYYQGCWEHSWKNHIVRHPTVLDLGEWEHIEIIGNIHDHDKGES